MVVVDPVLVDAVGVSLVVVDALVDPVVVDPPPPAAAVPTSAPDTPMSSRTTAATHVRRTGFLRATSSSRTTTIGILPLAE
jgi:hypothetical protein